MDPVTVEGLTKSYGDVVAIDSLTFSVQEGEIFGYLGPNGAGKTTTIRTLLGLLTPTSGTGQLLGADIHDENALLAVKERIGYLPDTLGFDEDVTGKRILDYHASIKGESRREELTSLFSPPLDRPVRTYSAGNRRMLGIIQAFMHDPDLVIMDEPTSGLDPLKQDQFNEFITDQEKTTMFFSSHILSEVSRVCDRVGILRDGSLATLEDVGSLLKKGGKRLRVHSPDEITPALEPIDGVVDLTDTGETVRFTYTGEYNRLLAVLTEYDILDIEIAEPPLEEIFLHYYNDHTSDRPREETTRREPTDV